MNFDWQQFKKDLKWAENMTRYRYGSFGSQPKTQRERAEILETNQAKLSRIENGSKNIKISEFVDWCEKMKVNPEKYFINE